MSYCLFHQTALSLLFLPPFIESSLRGLDTDIPWDSIRFSPKEKNLSTNQMSLTQASKVYPTRELWHWNLSKPGDASCSRSGKAKFQSEVWIRLYSFPQQEHEHNWAENEQWGGHQTDVRWKWARPGSKHAPRFIAYHECSPPQVYLQTLKPMIPGKLFTLQLKFEYNLTTSLVGFYLSTYKVLSFKLDF